MAKRHRTRTDASTDPATPARPAPRHSPFHGQTLRNGLDASQLVIWLNRSQRPLPTVLLTRRPNSPNPLPAVLDKIGDEADVTLIAGDAIQSLRQPGSLGTVAPYGGAARIFPTDDRWIDHPSATRIVRWQDDPQQLVQDITHALRRLASRTTPAIPPGQSRSPADPQRTPLAMSPTRSAPPALQLDPDHPHVTVDAAHAQAAIDHIRSHRRPLALVTAPNATGVPIVDVDAILEATDGRADIIEIDDPTVTRTVTTALPPELRAWNGAVRVVAGDRHPRIFPRSQADGRHATEQVIETLLGFIYAGGYTAAGTAAAAPAARPAKATVRQIVGSRVVLQDDARHTLAFDSRAIVEEAQLPTARLFAVGQRLHGTVRTGSTDFTPELRWRDGRSAVAAYVPGSTVLGRAVRVFDDRMRVELFPAAAGQDAVSVAVTAVELLDGTPHSADTDLRPVVPEGATVALHIRDHGADGWQFAVPDPAMPVVPAPSILDGGPSWLGPAGAFDWVERLQGPHTLAELPVERLLESVGSVEDARSTIGRLHAQLRDARSRADRLARTNRELEETNQRLRQHNRDYARAVEASDVLAPFRERFATPADRMDWELRATAILQMSPEDRRRHPLPDSWGYGGGFFDSVDACPDMARNSLLRTMLAVACRLDDDLRGLELHALRTGPGGDNPQRRDEQGRPIFRVTIHGQYRLHFVRDEDGAPVFLSATRHEGELW